MSDVAGKGGLSHHYGLRGVPRWTWAVLPLVLAGGLALARTSTSVARTFSPPAGPPDTLAALRVPAPKTPVLPSRFLERAVTSRPPGERVVQTMASRYRVTHTMARMIHDAAVAEGLDPELAFRLIRVESVFDPDAVSRGGAVGLVQMMPGTARTLDPEIDTRRELLDPRTNMRLGFAYLRDMIERYQEHGDDAVRLGVLAYNRGEVAVDRALRRGADPENGYGPRVLGPRAHAGQTYRGPGIIPPRPPADSVAPGP